MRNRRAFLTSFAFGAAAVAVRGESSDPVIFHIPLPEYAETFTRTLSGVRGETATLALA